MKVLVTGAGNMGSGFVKQLSDAGNTVRVTARDADAAKAAAFAAAEGQDIVILATGFGDAVSALQSVGDLQGKVVVDITDQLTAD